MNKLSLLLCFALLGFLFGCDPDGSSVTVPDDVETLVFEPVAIGQNAAVTDTTVVIFRDSLSWAAEAGRFPSIEDYKPVDFDQSMIVVVGLPRSTGGYSIEVESVDKIGDEIMVSFIVNEPGSDCLAVAALTYPFQAVAVRKADGRVGFSGRTVRYNCSV